MSEASAHSLPGTHSGIPASSALRDAGVFIAITFSISWVIWISALKFGAHAGTGEEFLAFGSCGPALASILLVRGRQQLHSNFRAVGVAAFVGLCLCCWGIYVLSDKLRGVTPHPSARFLCVVASLAAIPGLLISRLLFSKPLSHSGDSTIPDTRAWRWRALAFFAFPVLLLAPTAILRPLGMPLERPQFEGTALTFAGFGVAMLLRNFFFTAVFEEPGWRGFLLARLQSRFSPLLATFLTWLPWALWHLPLDRSSGLTQMLVSYSQLRVIFLIPMAIIFTWLWNRSGGDLWTVMIFHACMNTFPFFLPYVPAALGLVFIWAAYAVIADRMWRRAAILAGERTRGRI